MSIAGLKLAGVLSLILSGAVAGCSAPPPGPSSGLAERYLLSRSAVFHYRVPVAWVDHSPTSRNSEVELRLSNQDLTEAIEVREIHRWEDDQQVSAAEEEAVVRLIAGLDSAGQGEPVGSYEKGGRMYWTYEGKSSSGEPALVTLVVIAGKVFEIRSVGLREGDAGSLHQEFVDALRW